jgi:Zn-dependent metalloprotease
MRRTGTTATALLAATLVAGTTGSVVGAVSASSAAPRPHGFTRSVADDGAVGRAALQAVAAHPQAVRSGNGQSFTVTGALVDPDGTRHVRLVRSYAGLPVLGGDLVVHQSPQGAWEGRSQTLSQDLTLSVVPTVSRARAGAAAVAPSQVTRSISGDKVESTKLVVDATGATPRLAYEVVTGGTQKDGTPSRLASFVDARTGAVLHREQQIETIDGSGQSLYGGTVPLQLTQNGSSYELKDPTRGNTYTTDMNNGQDAAPCQVLGSSCLDGALFTSPDPSFGDGTTSSRESAGVDAQYGTNATWDYYKNVQGRNGIFDTGAGSFNRVHYGVDYVNAFWDGTKMTYGDGDGTNYGPLTSLDVAGHEMSHGVTEHSANLNYFGESGGLNESTSDIFGTAVEFYANNPSDPGDYLIGEQFDLVNHVGIRRMDTPSSDGSSVDCWDPNVGQLDVHYSSGVGNHFFYLVSEGSGTKVLNGVSYSSDTCGAPPVIGIGHDDAARIWYRALTVYMTSNTDYHGARDATLAAATDLFGPGTPQANAVDAAWAGAGVHG